MLDLKLNAVQGFVLKYLARAGMKKDEPAAKDFHKAIQCLEKLMEVTPPPAHEDPPPMELEASPQDEMGALPKSLRGWILPIPILLILRWLIWAWRENSTRHHRHAIAEIKKLLEQEEAWAG